MKQQTAEELAEKYADDTYRIGGPWVGREKGFLAGWKAKEQIDYATIENLSSTVVEQESKLDIAVKALEEIKRDIYENDVEQVISIIEEALKQIKTKE